MKIEVYDYYDVCEREEYWRGAAFTRIYTSMYEIDIKTELSLGLDEHKDYTIAELCGFEALANLGLIR